MKMEKKLVMLRLIIGNNKKRSLLGLKVWIWSKSLYNVRLKSGLILYLDKRRGVMRM
jgi:hypothetical protein